MELTIAPQSYQPDGNALIRAIQSAASVLARTVVDEQDITPHAGDPAVASAFVCPARPGVRAVNFTAALELPAPDANANANDATSLIASIDHHFTSQQATCQVLYPRQAILPKPLAEAAQAAGYEAVRRKVFLLTNYKRPTSINEKVQIVPARAIYPQLPDFYKHMAKVEHTGDAQNATDFPEHFAATMIDFLDESRLELLVARVDGKNLAAAGVLSLGQIGVIIPAWSDPQARGQGIAKTLMTHLLDFCARALFTQVIIDRSEHCTAVPFYQSLGFVAAAEYVKYRRPFTSPTSPI